MVLRRPVHPAILHLRVASCSSLAHSVQHARVEQGGQRHVGGVGPVQVAQHARQACGQGSKGQCSDRPACQVAVEACLSAQP